MQLFFIYFGLPRVGIKWSGETCAIVGLIFLGGAYMAEALRSGLDSIATIQWESASALGLTRVAGINLNGITASVLVFTLWGGAEMGDLVRGALIAIPRHQYESAYALGLSPRQTMRRVILPQTLRALAPPAVNLITRMVKTTSLVVLIGVVEVLKVGQQIIDANRFNYPTASLWIYGLIFALYFLICWPISLLSRHMEKTWQN